MGNRIGSSPPICIFCELPSQFPTVYTIARSLLREGKYFPIVVFDLSTSGIGEFVRKAIASGLYCIDYQSPSTEIVILDEHEFSPEVPQSMVRRIIEYIRKAFTFFPLMLLRNARSILTTTKALKKLLKLYKPIINIIPVETCGYYFQFVPLIASQMNIPTVIVPFCFVTRASTELSFLNHSQFNQSYSKNGLMQNILFFFYPHWFTTVGVKTFTRLPPWAILPQEILGVAKPNPWVDNYGFSNAVFVENEFQKNAYENEGVPSEKIIAIGSLHNDRIHRILVKRDIFRRRISKCAGFSKADPHSFLIVLNPPEMYLDRGCAAEYKNYESVLKEFLMPFCHLAEKFMIFVVLHPNSDRVFLCKLLVEYDFVVWDGLTSDIIACADLYVTITSASIFHSIFAGVPTIEFDLFGVGNVFYSNNPQIFTVNTFNEYKGIVQKTLCESSKHTELYGEESTSIANSEYIPASKRFISAIEKITFM